MQLPRLPSAERITLALSAEQTQLLTFLIRQRVAISHLEHNGLTMCYTFTPGLKHEIFSEDFVYVT